MWVCPYSHRSSISRQPPCQCLQAMDNVHVIVFDSCNADGLILDQPHMVQAKGPGFMRLLHYNRPEWHWILFGVVGSAIVGMIMPTFALSIGNVIAVLFVKDFNEMNQQVWVAIVHATYSVPFFVLVLPYYAE